MEDISQAKKEYYYKRHRLTKEQVSDLRDYDENWSFDESFSKQKKFQQMKIVAELFYLTKLFLESGLEFIPMKGPVLSWRLHKDFLVRRYKDIDLLFDIEDIEKVSDVLIGAGYEAQYFTLPKTKNKRHLVLTKFHHLVFQHPDRKVSVEIHWKLSTHNTIRRSEVKKIIGDNFESLSIQGYQFKVFSNEMEFVYLIIHGAKHKWMRLKWLHDIYCFYRKKQLNFDKVLELATAFKCKHLLLQSECLVNHFFNCNEQVFADRISRNSNFNSLFQYTIKCITKAEPTSEILSIKEMTSSFLYLYKAFPIRSYRIGMIKDLMFRELDMSDLILPDRLAYMYILYRPISFLKRRCFGKN
ncbi:nucleotidyltransferase domain-containing protein [Labilibaculum euxinus]